VALPSGSGARVAVLTLVASLAIVGVSCEKSALTVLPWPAPGQTIAAYLDDGRPVFVVGHEDGDISVLDAFSTHVPYGVRVLIGWCPMRRTFHDPRAGGGWDEWGALRSGPPPKGLGYFRWELSPASDASANEIKVTGFAGDVPGRAAPDARPQLEGCDFSTWAYHTFEGVTPLTPAAAVASSSASWVLMRGRIDFAGKRLCSEDAECLEPADVLDLGDPGAYPNVGELERPWEFVALVRDGSLVHLSLVILPAPA